MPEFSGNYDGIVLFSGGLDSILAAKVLEEQGLKIRCVHFVTPFFGSFAGQDAWREKYGLDVACVDAGEDFIKMLCAGPEQGFGKTLNPCIDCKIFLLRKARLLMDELGAAFLATGEVIGQRPMSQRRDALHLISREAGVRDVLLRPLCAKCLPPTPLEERGLVKRDELLGVSGRGRKEQYALAEKYGIRDIPAPGGGCLLTASENARAYWPLIEHGRERAADFQLANIGRQFWRSSHWLCIGRHQGENEQLVSMAQEADMLFKTAGFSGPVALARDGRLWPDEVRASAAAFVASFSPGAVRWHAQTGQPVSVRLAGGKTRICAVFNAGHEAGMRTCQKLETVPQRFSETEENWGLEPFESIHPRIRAHGERRRQEKKKMNGDEKQEMI